MASPFVEVSFPLVGNTVGFPSRLVVQSSEFKHEIATLTFGHKGAYYPQFMTGTPVYIRYGTRDNLDTFVGYVDHVQPSTAVSSAKPELSSGEHTFTVVCVGATWLMKSGGQRVFSGLSGHSIASQLLTRYGLAADADPHSRVWPMRVQPGISDWSFLVDLAHDIGYTVLPERTLVRFHASTRDFAALARESITFNADKAVRNGIALAQPHISKFVARLGENVPDSSGTTRSRRIAYSYDIKRNSVTQVVDETGANTLLTTQQPSPVFTQYATSLSSGESMSDSASALSGTREDSRWHITATATLAGDARVRAGRLIYTKNLPNEYSGYWYVRSCTHSFAFDSGPSLRPGTYTMSVDLGRDGTGDSYSAPSSHPTRALGIEQPPLTKLTDKGTWRSAYTTPLVAPAPEVVQPSYVKRRLANR